MKIFVCVGSSCHLKGSYHILEAFKQAVADNHLEDDITLSAAFCLGKCRDGVSIKIDEEIVTGLSLETFPDVWQTKVLKPLGK
ncbi:MAG TPA: (2Fe-2S) ferredoxin domain-containing protein [Tissierellia bacterium]|nr:(2Fe-2S) ferredoxin domain-containing protein [Tissierellia bacterium]